MSGRRNHYVPKWLLRRFRRLTGPPTSEQVYVVRADGKAYWANIDKVAVAREFYGNDANGLERGLAEQFDNDDPRVLLAFEQSCDPVLWPDIARLVWRLAIRTKATRHQFATTARDLVTAFFPAGEHPALLDSLLQRMALNLDRMVAEESLPRSALAPWRIPPHVVWAAARLQFAKSAPEVDALLRRVLPAIQGMIPHDTIAASGQIKGMLQLLERAEDAPVWTSLTWSLHRHLGEPLVLGDSIGFALDEHGRLGPLIAAGPNPRNVIVPVRPNLLLVGGPVDAIAARSDPMVSDPFSPCSSVPSHRTASVPALMLKNGRCASVTPAFEQWSEMRVGSRMEDEQRGLSWCRLTACQLAHATSHVRSPLHGPTVSACKGFSVPSARSTASCGSSRQWRTPTIWMASGRTR